MSKLNQLIKEAQDLQKQLEKLHMDRNHIFNNWKNFGQTTIGGVSATNYLTADIIQLIMDGISVKIKMLDNKLKELEGRIN
jgi:hypothetical protein